MKSLWLVAVLILAVTFVVYVADGAIVRAQDVHDFEFSSFEADYYLSKDNEGRSRLRVVEKLTAEFPEYDQNKGIVRAIPISYEGRPLSFELESVKRNGRKEPVYDKSTEKNLRVIELGTDEYVHGTQVYKITYTMRDVTRDFGDYQEFFWDTTGTQWKQTFHQLTARVHLEEGVEGNFTGTARCYEGIEGLTDQCDSRLKDNTVVFEANGQLFPGETVSMLMEFEKDTFAPYDEGVGGVIRNAVAWASLGLAAIAFLTAVWLKLKNRDAKGRGVIIPRYSPPQELSVLLLASIETSRKKMKKAVPAQFIDLAVRGKVAIIELRKKRFFIFNTTQYIVKVKNKRGLHLEEAELVKAFLNGWSWRSGYKKQKSRRQFNTSKDRPDDTQMYLLRKSLREQVVTQGYRRKVGGVIPVYGVMIFALVIAFALFGEMHASGFDDARMTAPLIVGVLFFLLYLVLKKGVRPLTEQGREVVDHLKGVESYIKLAEAERLRVLQSPEGAQTNAIDTDDKQQVVKLYEELLPYAVLFGQEKQWSKQLAMYYDETDAAPAWYGGVAGFNSGGFASSVNSFTSSTSSSSSGFSGGGAGGGGGGGGGGGR